MDLVISALAFILVLLVAGNSLAICVGTVISSSIIKRRSALLIAIVGYVLGLVTQGSLLGYGFSAIMPQPSYLDISTALFIGTLIFIISHKFRVSQSLSITFATSLIGISLASGQMINFGFVALMIALWIMAPAASLILAEFAMKATPMLLQKKKVWETLAWIRLLLVILSFFTAFTLGANTLGLLFASVKTYTSIFVVIIAIIVGSLVMGRGEIRRLGNDILPLRYINAIVSQAISVGFAEGATVAGVPLSNTPTFTASIYGTGLAYKTSLFIKKTRNIFLMTWIATAFVSLFLGYGITWLVLYLH